MGGGKSLKRQRWLDTARHPTRRDGAVLWALLLLPWVAGLVLVVWHPYHHVDVGTVVAVIFGLAAVSLGLATLWVTWAGYRVAKAAGPSVAEIADGLAARLRSQWAEEAEARGLNDPYPLPVAWTPAKAPLAGDLDALKTLATTGAGWSTPVRENWAKGSRDLAGGGKRKLADVLAMVPTGRLVVLGEPGTGKTMLMVSLMLDLLNSDRRSSGGRVPVLAPLASWDPVSQDLHLWLGATLSIAYPDLAGAPPPGSAGDNRFEALVEGGLILPILDGLDEIPEPIRPMAISRINKELKPGEQIVVTCRTEQYRAAVSQGIGLSAAAVQLNTVKFDEVVRYLRKTAGPAAEDRWDFLKALSAESPIRQALATPLMAGLARTIYNPRPGELAATLRNPAELCGQTDKEAVELLLFDAFIPAAYRNDPAGPWKARDAEAWLVFLARHLEQTIESPDLAWWQLGGASPHTASTIAGRRGGGLLGRYRTPLGASRAEAPSRGVRIRIGWFAFGLVIGLAVGLVIGLAVGLANGLKAGLTAGFFAGLGAGLPGALQLGTGGVPGDLEAVTSPGAVFARDRQVALLVMVVGGLVGGLLGCLSGALGWVRAGGLVDSIAVGFGLVLLVGLTIGFFLAENTTRWPSYIQVLARGKLARHHPLPWRLMSFLADAHGRGVLRQAGAVYQFRHIELQHRLANRDVDKRPASSPAAAAAEADG